MNEKEKIKRSRPDQRSEEPSQVFPHLYLGGAGDLAERKLEQFRITHILNATTSLDKPENVPKANFMRVPVLDSMSEVILDFLSDCVDYIEQRRKANEKVLVHCVAGISRSATIAIAYTMKHMSLNVQEAYDYVKERRPKIAPNIAFMGQLLEYQKMIRGEDAESITALPSPQKILPPVVGSPAPPKVTKKDRSGLSLSLSGALNRKRKRTIGPQTPATPSASPPKRPTLLSIEQQPSLPYAKTSHSDPVTPREASKIFKKSDFRQVQSETDRIGSEIESKGQKPLKASRVRHASAGDFNQSD